MKKITITVLSFLTALPQKPILADIPTPLFFKNIGTREIASLCFIPESSKLACYRRGTEEERDKKDRKNIQVWDIEQSQLLFTKECSELSVPNLHVTTDGKQISLGNWFGNISVFNMEDATKTKYNLNKYRARTISRSTNGKYIAVGFDDGTLNFGVFGIEKALTSIVKAHTKAINQVAFSPDKHSFASASNDGSVKVWNLEGKSIDTEAQEHAQLCIAFSPDSKKVAFGGHESHPCCKIIGEETRTPLPGTKNINCIIFSPCGGYIIAGSCDGTLYMWDTINYQLIGVINSTEHAIYSLAISSDGKYLAIGDEMGNVFAWLFADLLNYKESAPHSDQTPSQSSSSQQELAEQLSSLVHSLIPHLS